MKQNAVGLANICILSTMVLISVSTTVSMYLGMEDTLNTACPNEINLSASFYGEKDTDMVENVVDEMAKNMVQPHLITQVFLLLHYFAMLVVRAVSFRC